MKRRIAAFFLAASVLLAAGCKGGTAETSSDQSWKKIAEAKQLVIGVDIDNRPMTFREDQEMQGFDIDLANEVCTRLNVNVLYQDISQEEAAQALDKGLVDCYWSGYAYSTERSEQLTLSAAYVKAPQILLTTEEAPYRNMAELKGGKLGYVEGSAAGPALEAAEVLKSALQQVSTYETIDQAKEALLTGQVDVIVVDYLIALDWIHTGGGFRVILDENNAPEDLAVSSNVIAFRRGNTALMQKVQEALLTMARDKKTTEISEKWFGQDVFALE